MKYQQGDKVKIPTRKTTGNSIYIIQSDVESNKLGYSLIEQVFEYRNYYEVRINPDNKRSVWEFNEEDLEPYIDTIPEKWCIKITEENKEEIAEWANSNSLGEVQNYRKAVDYHLHSNEVDIGVNWKRILSGCKKHPEYTEITIEQFRQITQTQKMEKKVVGYKAPMDLYAGKIKKGHLYVPNTRCADYYPEVVGNGSSLYNIAQEIVETWEPVYEAEEKILKLGDKGIEVKIGKGYIRADGGEFDIDSLEELLADLTGFEKLSGYKVEIVTFKIGCTTVSSPGELKDIIDTYKELNNE